MRIMAIEYMLIYVRVDGNASVATAPPPSLFAR
jgi:hypothetical protein